MKNILLVINGEANDPVEYSADINNNLDEAVAKAARELGLSMNKMELEDAASEIAHGRVYWFNGTHCFTNI